MKFHKKYEEYMQEQQQTEKKLPWVDYYELKKILEGCRKEVNISDDVLQADGFSDDDSPNYPKHSACECDGTFFPWLGKEMSEVVAYFYKQAQKLLELYRGGGSASAGLHKCFMIIRSILHGNNHAALIIQETRDLVTYALFNSIAMRKLLKKYDKITLSERGQAFKSLAQTSHVDILKSPWLCELIAFHINLRETRNSTAGGRKAPPAIFEGGSLILRDGKPSLVCELFDSIKLDIDLTCAICLDTIFDPVSLTCGHILCYMCACKAASVTIVDGLKTANSKEKCPVCREEGVYEGVVHLEELHILLKRSCPQYWEERHKTEKVERVQQVKEHWELQCRLFMGI